jgi:hypothetical protein
VQSILLLSIITGTGAAVQVIEVQSQAVLTLLTEHDFQDASKTWKKR